MQVLRLSYPEARLRHADIVVQLRRKYVLRVTGSLEKPLRNYSSSYSEHHGELLMIHLR